MGGKIMTYEEMTAAIDRYNWDDGFAFPQKILEQPACDLALALRIFYLGDGYGYFQILSHNIGGPVEWLQFIGKLYTDINEGRYRKSEAHGVYQIPLTAVQKYRLQKQGFPPVFLEDL